MYQKMIFIMTGLEGEQYCIIKEKFHKKYTILESDIKGINFAKKISQKIQFTDL